MKFNVTDYLKDLDLNEFFRSEERKAERYIKKHFSFPTETIQDIFQDSAATLIENITSGKLKELTSTLSTYFISICWRKAMETSRDRGNKTIPMEAHEKDFDESRINTLISDDDKTFSEEDYNKMIEIVKDLPEPCDSILWYFYKDNKSMNDIAVILGYSGADVAKTTKSRCLSKLKNRFFQNN